MPRIDVFDGFYIVKPGDNLTKIAYIFGTSVRKIQSLNDYQQVFSGMKIKIKCS